MHVILEGKKLGKSGMIAAKLFVSHGDGEPIRATGEVRTILLRCIADARVAIVGRPLGNIDADVQLYPVFDEWGSELFEQRLSATLFKVTGEDAMFIELDPHGLYESLANDAVPTFA